MIRRMIGWLAEPLSERIAQTNQITGLYVAIDIPSNVSIGAHQQRAKIGVGIKGHRCRGRIPDASSERPGPSLLLSSSSATPQGIS
jgi:hypothetical protein